MHKLITFKQLVEALSTHHYGDWEVVRTNHIKDRTGRTSSVPEGHWDTFHHRAIAEIERRTEKPLKNGEYMIHSRSLGDPKNPGMKVVANLDRKPGKKGGQLRHITHLEPHMVAKAGTPTIKIESVESSIPVIEIE